MLLTVIARGTARAASGSSRARGRPARRSRPHQARRPVRRAPSATSCALRCCSARPRTTSSPGPARRRRRGRRVHDAARQYRTAINDHSRRARGSPRRRGRRSARRAAARRAGRRGPRRSRTTQRRARARGHRFRAACRERRDGRPDVDLDLRVALAVGHGRGEVQRIGGAVVW